jgi:hypothetical protein
MNTYNDKTTGLHFEYPSDWTLDLDSNVFSLYDMANGVGALQISSYTIPNVNEIKLENKLAEHLDHKKTAQEIHRFSDHVYTNLIHDNKYWQYWMLLKNQFLVFITYNCFVEDMNKEDDIIMKIITSIK